MLVIKILRRFIGNGNLILFYYWNYITSWWSFNIFEKIFYSLIKITLTDEFKILDDKIKVYQAQYDLDREAKISALSPKNLQSLS